MAGSCKLCGNSWNECECGEVEDSDLCSRCEFGKRQRGCQNRRSPYFSQNRVKGCSLFEMWVDKNEQN